MTGTTSPQRTGSGDRGGTRGVCRTGRAGGCRYDDGAPYVQAAYEWFVRVGVVAVSIWHEPTGYDGVLLAPSGEHDTPTPRWPETSGRVKRFFGAG